jgi:hypothetical protein
VTDVYIDIDDRLKRYRKLLTAINRHFDRVFLAQNQLRSSVTPASAGPGRATTAPM